MAYFKITQNKKGELQAKIQVSGKDLSTGKSKVFTKRVYNTDELTEAKFRKQVEKTAIAFEEEVSRAYQDGKTQLRSKVLTFSELMQEWKANIKAGLSVNYYERAEKVEKIFGEFLEQNGLADKPISAITVRDVQRFLSSFTLSGYKSAPKARLKKPLPKQMNFRLMARENVIDRCASYNLIKKGANIAKETAETLCDRCGLDYDEYFETIVIEKPYAAETIKGYRRILRALFNEAVRYEWIAKNPVCATKVGAEKRSSHREYNQIQTGIALSSDEKRAPKFLSEFFFYTVINRHDSKVSQFLYYTHAYTVSDMDRLVRPFRNVYKSQIPYASKILLPAGFPRCPLIHLRNRCPQTVFMDTIKL